MRPPLPTSSSPSETDIHIREQARKNLATWIWMSESFDWWVDYGFWFRLQPLAGNDLFCGAFQVYQL